MTFKMPEPVASDHLAYGTPVFTAHQMQAAYEQGRDEMADFAIEAALCELDGSGQARAIEKAIRDHLKASPIPLIAAEGGGE